MDKRMSVRLIRQRTGVSVATQSPHNRSAGKNLLESDARPMMLSMISDRLRPKDNTAAGML
jgi:hypothetical protein